MKRKIRLCLLLLSLFGSIGAQEMKRLETPYYTYPRTGAQHIDLSADWKLTSTPSPIQAPSDLNGNEWFGVSVPTSIQFANFKAGKLGNPYIGMNALEHEKLEQQVWYYKKTVAVPGSFDQNTAILSFDGIDYFSKVWINGQLVGLHQGMFGGPTMDVSTHIRPRKENEIVVEVLSANYGNPDHDSRIPGKIVKGWFFTGGSAVEPFFHLGMWRGARLESLPHYHIERPFLFTRKIENNRATVGISVELFSGKNSLQYQLHPWHNTQIFNVSNPAMSPQNRCVADNLTVMVQLKDASGITFEKEFKPHVIEGRCWLDDEFTVPNPRLWYPNGLGEAHFYTASVCLKVKGVESDRIEFPFGIRTIEQTRSAGVRTNDRWVDWQFVINGKKAFIKGINWMPVDALSDLSADKYDWAVSMAKSAGIQMFRIWGAAYIETREFYDACNKYGILVWQDFCIANFDTPEWPQEVWEAQVCQNIFRLRNEPSLAVWCGGNEFNPYSHGNAATVGILERNLKEFDPSRLFVRTSPDGGSLHSYPDFDPNWYKQFNLVPYIAETGIHCMTDARGNREMIDNNEFFDLGRMFDKSFGSAHPEFALHFAEYNPARVPRMLSRATHIDNMNDPSLESIVEATQIGAGEFYQVMSEGFQGNYPVTTGLMPWVYKRPWPVVAGINLVDGHGHPSAPYYFLKRTYDPVRISLDLPRMLFRAGEQIAIKANLLNSKGMFEGGAELKIQVLDDTFAPLAFYSKQLNVDANKPVATSELGTFTVPSHYKDRFFFLVAELTDTSGKLISRAEYWPRTPEVMERADFYNKYTTTPTDWPTLDKGPWLRPTVERAKTSLRVTDLKLERLNECGGVFSYTVENSGKKPSFNTSVEIDNDKRIFYATNNNYWLAPGEKQRVEVHFKFRDGKLPSQLSLEFRSWNTRTVKQTLPLSK